MVLLNHSGWRGLWMLFLLTMYPAFLQVESCDIIGTDTIPPKWSDHAAMVVAFRDVAPTLSLPHQVRTSAPQHHLTKLS